MSIKYTAELWREIFLNLLPDSNTEQVYFLLRVSALFIRTASCKRDDFLGEKPSPVVCKLVCFPFAACLPWSASVMESRVKQLELHLGPLWSCCDLQAPVRARLGGCRGGTGWCWASPWAALGQPLQTAAPAQGSSPWACSMGLGDSSREIPSADHSGCCGGTSGCSVPLPAVGPVVAACQRGAAFKSAADIPEEGQRLRLYPQEGLEMWQQEALTPLAVAAARVLCTRARVDPPPGALTGSALFYLLLTCLANNGCGALAFLFLITVVSSVNILEPTLMLERLTLFFFFL